MTHLPLARRFANWTTGLSPPDEVRYIGWSSIPDTHGVTVAGGVHPKVQAFASVRRSSSGCANIVFGETDDADTVILENGLAAHAWDFDDTSHTGFMHGSSVVQPVAPAPVEDLGTSEENLLTAFRIGSEVAYVLADIRTRDHYFQSWWSAIKFSLVCSAAHGAIEQFHTLLKSANAKAEDIATIHVTVPELVSVSLVYPLPMNVQQAQFSLPYALNYTALYGHVRLQDLLPQEISAVEKMALIAKVSTEVSLEFSKDEMWFRIPEYAHLRVTFLDGRVVEGFNGEAYGMPSRPRADQDLESKSTGCIRFACGSVSGKKLETLKLLKSAAYVFGKQAKHRLRNMGV